MLTVKKQGSMSNHRWKISAWLLTTIIICGFLYVPSDDFADDLRAKYICGFIRQITWSNKETKLTIGILESNTMFSDELRRQAIPENLRDKTLTVVSLKNLENLPQLNLLYVNKNRNPDVKVDSLMAVAETNRFLLISEAALFRESMINFVAVNGQTYYELNEQALQKAGFTYMSVLPFAAVKTKEDWEALFKETKQELDLLKVDYEQLKKEIEIQRQEIARQEKIISDNAIEIALMAEEIKRRQEQIDAQLAQLKRLTNEISATKRELDKYHAEIEQQKSVLEEKQKLIDQQTLINQQFSKEIDEKMAQIGNLNTRINEYLATLKMQNVIIVLGALLVVFLAVFGFYAFRNYRQKQRVNLILKAQNEEITQQRDEIAHKNDVLKVQNEEISQQRDEIAHKNDVLKAQNEEISQQRDMIAHQNKEITDSIIYARRIQTAILPTPNMLKDDLEMYIFYRPRDIVSGDFYWMSKKEDKLIIVAADCTGHGVPGAFMSMLGVAFLNEIVGKENELYANEILNKLRDNIVCSLNQAGRIEKNKEYTKDGMDIALCVIDYPSMTLQYAGAYNPLILIRNDELTEIKADRMPVAYSDAHGQKQFTNNLIPLFPKDCIYMFSDGFADQFGGDEEKKYSGKRLKSTLLNVCELPMNEQENIMAQSYDEWKGKNEQIDDVLLIGIRV